MKNKKEKGRCGTSRVCLFVFRFLRDNPAIEVRRRMKVLRDNIVILRKLLRAGLCAYVWGRTQAFAKSLLELVFSLFSRRERIRRARLWRENSPSPAEEAVASFKVRSPKSAIFGGGKYTIVFLRRGFLSFCGRVSKFRARLTRKNSRFPPTLRFVRNSRSAQGNAWQKCDFAALYYTLFYHTVICENKKPQLSLNML